MVCDVSFSTPVTREFDYEVPIIRSQVGVSRNLRYEIIKRFAIQIFEFSVSIVLFSIQYACETETTFGGCAMVQNNQESRCMYWATRSSVRSHHSFTSELAGK